MRLHRADDVAANPQPVDRPPAVATTVLRGGGWTLGADVIGNIARFGATFLVARALGPDEFATWSILAVFVALGVALDQAGLHTTLVSHAPWTQPQASAAFWLSVATGTGLAFALPLIGLAIQTGTNVVPYLIVIGVSHITSTLALVPQATLASSLGFRRLAVIDASSRCIGAVSTLALAIVWRSVWVLVIGTVVQRLVSHTWLAVAVRFRPHLPPSVRPFRPFASFTIASYLTAFLGFLSAQIGTVVVAATLSESETGVWGLATLVLVTAQSTVATAAAKVLLPALGHVQSDRKASVYLRSISMITAVVGGVACVSTLLVPWTIDTLLNDEWDDLLAVAVLLLPAAFARGLGPLSDAFLFAHGRASTTLRWELVRLPLSVVSTVGLTAAFGLNGAALATAPLLVASVLFRARALRQHGVDASVLFKCFATPVLAAGIACVLPTAILIVSTPSILGTTAAIASFLVGYRVGLGMLAPDLVAALRALSGRR